MRVFTVRVPFSLLLAFAAFMGCASGPRLLHKHEFTLSPGQEHHAGLAKALLVPIDYTNEKPVRGLHIANDRIASLIVKHLESKGIAVERVDPVQFEQIANGASRAILTERKSGASGVVSAEVAFGDVVPKVLEMLDRSPDLVITADIAMRAAEYRGTRTIAWDGVKRRESISDGSISGSGLPAASLAVAAYTADGTRVFAGYGGLEPVFRIEGTKYVQRADLFQDERNLKEGVCIAFYPFFGMKEFCRR